MHVSTKAGDHLALCGGFVLTHCQPPKAVELGRVRPDGSVVTLDDVELEAGYLATVERHPEHGTVGGICPVCMVKVERLRWPGRAKRERASAVKEKIAAARKSKMAALAAKATDVRGKITEVRQAAARQAPARLRTRARARAGSGAWADELADRYGDA